MLLLPVYSSDMRLISPHIGMNTNASLSSSLPKSFPLPIEGREDFFSVDPKSFTIEQLNEYKKEMQRLMDIEKKNLKRINNNSTARINTYNRAIELAQETIKTHSIHRQNPSHRTFVPHFKPINDESIAHIDPKTLTITHLQLYIQGITEEITYEKKLTDEINHESTSRIEAYQHGIQNANHELSVRKEE